jgi:hypothetical protein
MARKNPPDHQRYQPVDEAFIRSVPFALRTPSAPPLEQEQTPTPRGRTLADSLPSPRSLPTVEELEDTNDLLEPHTSTTPERLDKPLKFRLPRSERVDVMRIVNRLGEQLQTSVEWSHVGRALVVLLRHAENEIIKHARRNGPLTRPPNDQAIALAEFEQKIAQIILRSLREVPPLR